MKSLVRGVHHITLCPGGAQQDIDFFTRVLGQRLIKQTVLMDGNIPIYHFYYGNADADVGSIATCFPYSRKPGRAGSGQLSCTSYTVPKGAIGFWQGHFDRHSAEHSGVQERFGAKYLRVRHPAGLLFEMIEDGADHRHPWTTSEIPRDAGTRGFFGAVLSVRDAREQESFFVDALGFQKVGIDGPYYRFEVPGAMTDTGTRARRPAALTHRNPFHHVLPRFSNQRTHAELRRHAAVHEVFPFSPTRP